MAWRNASRAHPCSICRKPDWICRHDSDSGIVDCYRACGLGGTQKRDKIGQVYWRHYPSGRPGSPSGSTRDLDADAAPDAEAPPLVYQHERADADTLHAVYSDLLDLLPLYEDHGAILREKRKLTPEEVRVLGYKSFPEPIEARRVIDRLVEKHGVEKLLSVPGFDRPERHVDMVDQTNGDVITLDATELRLSGLPGTLLPQRDAKGRIVGMMIRLDDPPNADSDKKLTRYLPLTSYTPTGCAAAIGVHVPSHDTSSTPFGVRVIEGIIKADIASLRTGILTVGIPSGGRWEQGIRLAEQLGAGGILLSPDADTRENMGICATLTFAAHNLEARGGNLFLEVWPFDKDRTLKGLDDVINAGKAVDVSVMSGTERWRTLRTWLSSSGAPPDPHVAARIHLDGVVENAEHDLFSAFMPGIAEAIAVLDAGSVEVQRLIASLKEHLRGRWRDFERKVKEARAKRSKSLRTQQLTEVVQSGRHIFKRGDQVEARDALLDDLTPVGATGFDHTLCVYDGGALYKFKDGIFVKIDEAALITNVTEFAGAPSMGGGVLMVSKTFAKGTVELSYAKCTKPSFFRDAPHGIAFKDIFLRVDAKAKRIREERLGREHRVRGRYDFEYVRKTPEKFLELLGGAFEGKPDKNEIIRVIQQFLGASISGLAPRFQRALLFRGKGNDAKSTIAAILSAAMPTGTVSAVPPQSFGHPYSRASLDGMLLNCVTETPENEILDAGPLKAIITGDKIEARNPYERPFTLEPRPGQLFVLNNIFKIKDTSRAFRRRWILLDFENEVEEADRFKLEQVIDEVPAIVSWAIEGLRDLLANDYVIPKSSGAAVDEWLGENDTVRQYAEGKLVPLTPEEKTDKKITWPKGDLVYADYQTWVKNNGHGSPMSSTRFFRRLGEHLGLRTDKDTGTKEGHTADGNTYPVRFREFAMMVARARADEEKHADALATYGVAESEAPLLLSFQGPGDKLPPDYLSGDLLALVQQADPDGRVAVLVMNRGEATLLVPARGEDGIRSYVASITDEHRQTIVTFAEKSLEGRIVREVVRLRRPEAPGGRPN